MLPILLDVIAWSKLVRQKYNGPLFGLGTNSKDTLAWGSIYLFLDPTMSITKSIKLTKSMIVRFKASQSCEILLYLLQRSRKKIILKKPRKH